MTLRCQSNVFKQSKGLHKNRVCKTCKCYREQRKGLKATDALKNTSLSPTNAPCTLSDGRQRWRRRPSHTPVLGDTSLEHGVLESPPLIQKWV